MAYEMLLSLGHEGPCTFLVQWSADEHSSTCLFFLSFLFPTRHLLNVFIKITNKKGINTKTKKALFGECDENFYI
jgi:hypothetical protein